MLSGCVLSILQPLVGVLQRPELDYHPGLA